MANSAGTTVRGQLMLPDRRAVADSKAESNRSWESGLGVVGVVAAVIAVFQQSNGLRLGVGLLAAILLAAGLTATIRRASHRNLRMRQNQRRILNAYYDGVVAEFLKELPLPAPVTEQQLAQEILLSIGLRPGSVHCIRLWIFPADATQSIAPVSG